ncbi:NmrA family NAD(P)-binding protein [Trinickia acidisoli]|uniref:NmrA family NAD(P)-binding protein n=1 Tax=Trinickia acidisoli TaxID=2767482 RepID=UPI001A8EFBD9|nr:NmrA family NAD(P)-binding protein [Trinickia acidisoli]
MFVVFGASGKVGGVTAATLRKAGHPVRAVVRDARQAERLAAIGCDIAVADLTDKQAVRSAIKGARAVQILCPVPVGDSHPESTMRAMIDVAADALLAYPPSAVLALSDYGAQLHKDTGITLLYHYLETRLKPLGRRLTLLRSAEHLQNWARMTATALERGVLPSLHHPLSKMFPTVSAYDVGTIAAELLLDDPRSDKSRSDTPRIISVEGPHRITAIQIAHALTELSGREITALELPRSEWEATLLRAGLSDNHAQLIIDVYDAHNAGKIDVEPGQAERRFGTTPLHEAMSSLLSSVGHARSH